MKVTERLYAINVEGGFFNHSHWKMKFINVQIYLMLSWEAITAAYIYKSIHVVINEAFYSAD